ncbi:MAG: LamG-like jellyroll fold domain-containing protein [Verrucomicrobiales bacterium]
MNTELEPLVGAYLEGSISAGDMDRLNELLEADRGARSRFAECLNLDAALGEMAAGWMVPEEVSASEPRARRIRPKALPGVVRVVGIAAAVALAAVAVIGYLAEGRSVATEPFATVRDAAGVPGLTRDDTLRREIYRIDTGSVELLTSRGAKVVIEAPAEFGFESAQTIRLPFGRLAADVPPSAKGFTVITPDGDAVDLGTRFGVDVSASSGSRRSGSRRSEIHVFEGEVIARTGGGGVDETRSLGTGEALTLNLGSGEARELRSAAFIQPDEVEELFAGLAAGQLGRSETFGNELRTDETLIAHLDFESARHPGIYRTVQGRWPGSKAPEFVEEGDRLELDIGGDRAWPRLTLAAWVRLDRLGAPYQSLLHTDGWSRDNPGQVHWMINRNATMRLALNSNTLAPDAEERHGFPDSRTPVLPEHGRWVHLAVVYDSEAKTVRFYLNGEFDKETRQEVAHPARLGPARIGNWDQRDRKLSGRIDELVVLGRAMSDEEVRNLFDAGNPYR